MIGKTLSHYRILGEIGSGGMGVVYEAEDTRLKRCVALKVLPADLASDPQRMERFQREAEALASLNHPNIVTVYSVEEVDGVNFLTMELVRGENLDKVIPTDGMDLEVFFDVALPLADALSTAHEVGITHRDLKPANIMMGADGRLKVLDFGLAKLQLEESPGDQDDKTRVMDEELTGEGLIVGTIPYMSPEQLEGKESDARSDIFSLGIIMYQMATGQRPFQGDSSAAVMSSILKDSPQSVTHLREQLPRHLGRVISSCLEKDPDHRPQTAKGVRNNLRSHQKELETESLLSSDSVMVTRPAKPNRNYIPYIAGGFLVLVVAFLAFTQLRPGGVNRSVPQDPHATPVTQVNDRQMIVVLPFENLGLAEDEYFADGLTEEITSRLAAVKGLGVISRTSAMQYKTNRPPVRQIGQELGVDYVLEGTVRWERRGDGPSRIRVTPQLIRVADDTHLWSERYDQQLDEIFIVQSDIAEAVTRELNITLLEPEKEALAAVPTDNMEAYQAYLRAMELWNQPGYDLNNFLLAAQLMERAVELDPNFVLAWAELTSIHDMLYAGGDAGEEALTKAADALQHAEALDPDHPMVRVARGYHYYLGYLDYDRALEEFEAAAELLPNDSSVHEGMGYIRRRQGRVAEAVAQLEKARRLDPQNAHIHLHLAITNRGILEHAAADKYFDSSIALAPDGLEAYLQKAENLVSWRGAIAEAHAVLDQVPKHGNPLLVLARAQLLSLERDFEGAAEILSSLSPASIESQADEMVYYINLGICQLHLGQPDRARATFTRGYELAREVVAAGVIPGMSYGFLGMFEALLGQEDAARQSIQRGIEYASEDRFFGTLTTEGWASALVVLGHEEEAITILAELLATPYFLRITRIKLRLDPIWDPLRDLPAFQDLLVSDSDPDS